MIEHHTIQSYRVSGCDLDLSFNRLTVTDPATGNVIQVEQMDWQKLRAALGEYYALHASCAVGVEWFRDSAKHWDADDLKALSAAVAGAIAGKTAEATA
ncbi:hypothetical protein [uncultured phage MedDCM-OCT-S04-C231]|nr:hypothetical protein [uncultured phage MedDCM-OCT-S04-C1220]ADD94277.1 hypothetical protein [uncultured phage MedDCM-OCT-S04-C231]